MSRPPVVPAEDKVRIVLSVLAGEMTIAEAARRNKVSRLVPLALVTFVEFEEECSGGGGEFGVEGEALAADVDGC